MTIINREEPSPTNVLRWVPKSMMQASDLKLQQLYQQLVTDETGASWYESVEWRDVPIVRSPDSN